MRKLFWSKIQGTKRNNVFMSALETKSAYDVAKKEVIEENTHNKHRSNKQQKFSCLLILAIIGVIIVSMLTIATMLTLKP